MELRKDCSLIEVAYKNEGQKAILTFLDMEQGEVLEVNFNKQSYDEVAGKFISDPEKEQKVEEWCKEYFDTTFENLTEKVGESKDVYKYDGFNSLWEATDFFKPEKFSVKDKGRIHVTTIDDVVVDQIGIHIRYTIDDKIYQTNMNFSKWVDTLRKWFPNPQQKKSQYEKFEKKFGVAPEDAESIKGKEIMVEVRQVGKDKAWGDIKQPNWV